MIEIIGAEKSFDGRAAVSGLTMTVGDGDIAGVFGANGAGKSTLLRMIAGVLKPDRGRVLIDGANPETDCGVRETVFFLPDEQYFSVGETIKDTAKFYARFYRGFDRTVFSRLCESFELREGEKIGRLSKGMKKQVMMIAALSARPKYILLDEVFDGIDSISKQTLKNALARLSEEYGTTVITASHNIRELEDICRSVCLLYKSNLVLHRKTDELKAEFSGAGADVSLEEILTKELEARAMPTKISTSFKRPTGYYLYLLRKSIPFMILYAVLFFVTSPYFLYHGTPSRIIGGLDYLYLYMSAFSAMPTLTVAPLLGAVMNFKFLTSRSQTDRLYSLPLSKTALFSTHFLAGLTSLLLPYAIFANPLPAVFFSKSAETTMADLESTLKNLLAIYGLQALSLIAVFAFAVFLCVNLGKIFDICLYFFLLTAVLPIAASTIYDLLNRNLLGITVSYPSWYPALNFYGIFTLGLRGGSGADRLRIITIAFYAGAAVLFTALSFWLFRIRKRERAGSPFCFAYIKIVLAALASLFIGVITVLISTGNQFKITEFPLTVVLFAIVSAAAYAGAMALAGRSYKILSKNLFFYAAVLTAYAVLAAYVTTGAFGKITYIPKTEEIASAKITLNERRPDYGVPKRTVQNINMPLLEEYMGFGGGSETRVFTGAQGIEAVKAFHKNLLAHYREYGYDERELDMLQYSSGSESPVPVTSYAYELVSRGASEDMTSYLPSASGYESEDMTSYLPSASGYGSSYVSSRASGYGSGYVSSRASDDGSKEITSHISSRLESEKREQAAGGLFRSAYSPVFTYTLKNGATVERRYNNILTDWMDDSYQTLVRLPDEEPVISEKEVSAWLDRTLTEPFTVDWGSSAPGTQRKTAMLSVKQGKKLFLALYEDERGLVPGDYDSGDYCTVTMEGLRDQLSVVLQPKLIVKKNYRKTVKALDDLGFRPDQYGPPEELTAIHVIPAERLRSYQYDYGYTYGDRSPFAALFRPPNPEEYPKIWYEGDGLREATDADIIAAAAKEARLIAPYEAEGMLIRFISASGGESPMYYLSAGSGAAGMIAERYGWQD